MSAFNYYLEKGFTPVNKTLAVNEAATVAVWTPTTSTRIVVTNLAISRNVAGTIAFYWGNLAGTKIAEFINTGTVVINPIIGAWVSDTYDRVLFAKSTIGLTDGTVINVTGFEIP